MVITQKIVPCLWFDDEAEQAAAFYVDIFPNSRVVNVTHYGTAGFAIHGRPAGSVMTVDFELDGQAFTALNGGPVFAFNEAISLQVLCESQQEVDLYWDKLTEGGDQEAQQCGWLKDKYGLSWQVVPSALGELVGDADSGKSQNAMKAMLRMKKIDLDEIRRAYEGGDKR